LQNLHVQSLTQINKKLDVQNIQILGVDSPIFFKCHFSTKCAPLLKIGEDFSIDD
jgi:hypothetical protein